MPRAPRPGPLRRRTLAAAVTAAALAAAAGAAADTPATAATTATAAAVPVISISAATTGTTLTNASAGLSYETSDLALPGFTGGNLSAYLKTLGLATTEPPAVRRPSTSAASIMASAIRSFMLPVGFSLSILSRTRAPFAGAMRVSGTRDVLPMQCRMVRGAVVVDIQMLPEIEDGSRSNGTCRWGPAGIGSNAIFDIVLAKACPDDEPTVRSREPRTLRTQTALRAAAEHAELTLCELRMLYSVLSARRAAPPAFPAFVVS